MELTEFKRKKREDLLANVVDEFLNSQNENDFYFLLSQRLRGGNGKPYKNYDKDLPLRGNYEEVEVNGSQDSRRIVIDRDTKKIFATRDHYNTMQYVGRPGWAH